MIRTLIVDDSAVARMHLAALLQGSPDFEVVGVASGLDDAVQFAARTRPDLVVLDVFIPVTPATEVIAALHGILPVCIVLVSDAPRSCDEVYDALAAGAVDFVPKPSVRDPSAARAMLKRFVDLVRLQERGARAGQVPPRGAPSVVAIAASTGGPAALVQLLRGLPASIPVPIVVAQHMSEGFAEGFGRWLAGHTKLGVVLATDGAPLRPGLVYLGPPERDVLVRRGQLAVSVGLAEGCHPSGDALFASAVEAYGRSVVAVVLSGIGDDGAAGAARVREAGGIVMVQDRASAAIPAMPLAAAAEGGAELVGTPGMLARGLVELCAVRRGRGAG